ncbi:hypothetical protein BGX24_003845 [Mortierella sp. AD032]|nr:hypothetical protein BGX24_003845 [Mortierella sp. AD032]
MPARRKAGGHIDGTGTEAGGDSTEMTPMQELVRTSTAVPVISSSHPPPTTSSSIFQQSFYGSESTVTSNASSDADKGLLTSAGEKKSSCSDEEESVRGGGHLGITGQSDSDSNDGSDGGSVNLKDEHGRDVSPIAEVAAVVANTDDPSIPCLTFRFWVMGLFSIFSLSFVNQVSVQFWRVGERTE